MSQIELEAYLQRLEEYRKEVTSSKEKARNFLVELGIFTQDGKLTEFYKDLCIPQGKTSS